VDLDVFYTHKDLETAAVNSMQLPSEEYEGLGVAIMARLLALTGRETSMESETEDMLSSEEEARAALLTPQELDRIDASLMSHARPQWRKLAMIVSLGMADCDGDIENLSDAFYSRRVVQLVAEGKLLASRDLRRMRHCEVKLSESGHPRPSATHLRMVSGKSGESQHRQKNRHRQQSAIRGLRNGLSQKRTGAWFESIILRAKFFRTDLPNAKKPGVR
jgi:hypothetical protein